MASSDDGIKSHSLETSHSYSQCSHPNQYDESCLKRINYQLSLALSLLY